MLIGIDHSLFINLCFSSSLLSDLNIVYLLLQDLVVIDDCARYSDDAGAVRLSRVQTNENIIEKSLGKLKETGTVCFILEVFLSWKDYLGLFGL